MSWSYQYRIAGFIVQIDSDSPACEMDMQKFLKLYEVVREEAFDLKLSVLNQADGYYFVSENKVGEQHYLWSSADAREITAALEIHLYSQVVQYLHAKGIESIHSALLNVQGKAVMFAGVSGAGKSSICTAGLLAGAKYFSDEFSLLDTQGFVHPFPRPMQWEHEKHPAFNRAQVQETGLINPDYFDFPDVQGETTRCFLWHPQNIQENPMRLKHIVLHQYDKNLSESVLTAIPRHEALMALPEHLHVQHGMAKDLPMLNQRIDVECKFYRLHFPNVFEAWELIEQALTSPS